MAAREKSPRSATRREPLKDYARKRDFSRTAEPKPQRPTPKRGKDDGQQFVVQKHDARRVHYDLRLELGGTLKSWAVTRGPSLIAGEKRLAVRTEDHPMQYLDFEALLEQADLVITAEGSLDDQSPFGKIPCEVARRAKRRGLPVEPDGNGTGGGVGRGHGGGQEMLRAHAQGL